MQHRIIIEKIQETLDDHLPSGMLIAIKLKNIDALKLLMISKPGELIIVHPKIKKTPFEIVKEIRWIEAVLLFD